MNATLSAPADLRPRNRGGVRVMPSRPKGPACSAVTALVQVRLDPWTQIAEFLADLLDIECVRLTMVLAGDHDLAVVLDCLDLTELDSTVRQLRCIGAEDTLTQIVLRTVPGPTPGTRAPRTGLG